MAYKPESRLTCASCTNMRFLSVCLSLLVALTFQGGKAVAQSVLISEFMASNSSGIQDKDGDYSDWIEIQNNGPGDINLNGWYLSDDPASMTQWRFPAVVLDEGAYLVVFASGKNLTDPAAELHTNFLLDAAGEYLALVKPDGITVVHAYAPNYPEQVTDVSYGLGQATTQIISIGDTAAYHVPNPADNLIDFTPIGYNDSSWKQGPSSFGIGAIVPTDGLKAHWTFDSDASDSAGTNHGVLAGGASISTDAAIGGGSLSLDGASGHVMIGDPADLQIIGQITIACWIKIQSIPGNISNIVNKGHTTTPNGEVFFRISGGNYNFGSWGGSNAAVSVPNAAADIGTWVHVAGTYDGTAWNFYRNGELKASSPLGTGAIPVNEAWAIGARGTGTERFFSGLIDDVFMYNRGLTAEEIAILATPRASGGATLMDTDMLGISASLWLRHEFQVDDPLAFGLMDLSVKYEDGFVAWLNGTEVMRRNAPATLPWNAVAATDRLDSLANSFESISIQNHISDLVSGTNVLAIHALNDAPASDSFLIAAEISASNMTGQQRYLEPATPRQANGDGFEDLARKVKFSHSRGFYDTPFSLTLTPGTPGAQIHYTTDGSQPSTSHGSLYSGPISITRTTTLRAVSVFPEWRDSPIKTHTYIFLDDVIASPVMDKAITQSPVYGPQMRTALTDLPTLSLVVGETVTNLREARMSVEWLLPDGTEGFQEDGGVEYYGGNWAGPFAKQNFRLFFRSKYGASKLRYPLFKGHERGIPAVESFDQLELRAGSHDMVQRGFYMSNRFTDDTLLDMGQLNPHGQFIHLYFNGVYWGQYHLRERWNASMLAEYLGGEKEDYEAINGNQNIGGWADPGTPYDGDGSAWERVKSLRNDYEAIKPYLDVPQYIDYMLMFMFGNSEDEYRCVGPTGPGSGFKFYLNDADGYTRSAGDRTGMDQPGKKNGDGPGSIFSMLLAEGHPEYTMMLGDHIHKHYFNNGAMTPARTIARLQDRCNQVERAIFAETARWNYQTPASWEADRRDYINNVLPTRTATVIDQYRSAGFYPSTDAPVFHINGTYQHGGLVASGASLTMMNPNGSGTVYYTLDGSEPRLPGSTGGGGTDTTLVAENAAKRVTVPTGAISDAWRGGSAFDDTAWTAGTGGVGYERSSGSYPNYFDIDVETAMYNKNGSCYIRIPFTVTADDLSSFTSLDLLMRYDDGFVAYINGVEVHRELAPDTALWNSGATAGHSDSAAVQLQTFNITSHLTALKAGENLLAIHGLNYGTDSSDLLFSEKLVAGNSKPTGVSPTAKIYSGPITLTESAHVKSRTLDGAEWSALNEALFVTSMQPNSVIITEIMANPLGDDAGKEWFEIFNTTDAPVDIRGLEITDNDDDRHEINDEGPIWVAARGYLVLGASSDLTTNGGTPVDYAYGNDITLGNDNDEIILRQGDVMIHSVGYGGFTSAPLTISTDVSLTPDTGQAFGMAGNYYNGPVALWIDQYSTYGLEGNRGTPGAKNDAVYIGPGVDLNPPQLVAAFFTRSDIITLRFDDVLETASAEAITNYFIDNGIGSPVQANQASPTRVEIRFAASLVPETDHILTVSGVSDTYGNVLAPPVQVTVRLRLPSLTVSEILSAPAAGNPYEFIELHNSSYDTLVLGGETFTDGIDYSIPIGTTVEAGGYLVITKVASTDNYSAFRTYYGINNAVNIIGPYAGKLSNQGEKVRLESAVGALEIFSFTYDSARGWPTATNGAGHSLVPLHTDVQPIGSLDYGGNWRSSARIGGSPGSADPVLAPSILLNEFAAHTDYTNPARPEYDSNDWIELYNASNSAILLQTDWYLSDDADTLKKWPISPETILPPHERVSFDEVSGFHNPLTAGFGLNKGGEQLFLSHLPGSGQDRVVDSVRFKGQENGFSLGRSSDGDAWWQAGIPSRASANIGPVADVVIDEIMFHPPPSDAHPADNNFDEYIEIWNPTSRVIALETDTGTWRLAGGVDFAFPSGLTLLPGRRILLVNFDPANVVDLNQFKSTYGTGVSDALLLGPYTGSLSNSGERLAIERPQAPDAPGDTPSWVIVDEVIYFDQAPWTDQADATGKALGRFSAIHSGNDPENWAPVAPNPGTGSGVKFYMLTISGYGGSVLRTPTGTAYSEGTSVTLTPLANAGYLFNGWLYPMPPEQAKDNPLVIIMDADKAIKAIFQREATLGTPSMVLY